MRKWLRVVALLLLGSLLWQALPSRALVFVNTSPQINDSVVGQTVSGSFGINNNNTPPENFPVQFSNIDFYPSCFAVGGATADCGNGVIETGVYALSATGDGDSIPPGNATCEGTWPIMLASPGRYRFIPPGGEGTLVLAPGEFCIINFTATALRVPTGDTNPGQPGVQTLHASGTDALLLRPPAQGGNLNLGRRGDALESTVGSGPTALVTDADAGPATPGTNLGTASDTATLSPAPPSTPAGVAPGGTITFNLYGPFPVSPTAVQCVGVPVFTDTVTVNGFGNYATSASFPVTQAGFYNFTATYSGDANYAPIGPVGCGVAEEIVQFAQAQPTIVTNATPQVTVGAPVSDTATLSNGVNPTGTITFTLFGPGDANCTGAPIFTSMVAVNNGNGTYTSDPFTPTAPGSYNWVAVYSGDANNASATSPCGAPNETSVVGRPSATIVTNATPTVTVGEPITDTATVTGGAAPAPAPTGTVTFTLFGPGDTTCTAAPVFTSANRPLSAGPPFTATSEPFTPALPGEYRWVATYNGDGVYDPVTSPCNAPNETSVVNRPPASIVTSATPTVTIGSPISDTATVTGGPAPAPAPTGTVTFTLFGPNDANCTGAVIFTSADRPLTGGPPPTATSDPFTPTATGTYRWIATYNGDPVYLPVTSPCNAPGEASVVNPGTASITTTATPTAPVGGTIQDTATVTGSPAPAPAPTGTVTFTLFDNATCTGAPIFTSANRPLSGGPPPTATSAPFTANAPGSYNWIATYNGDQFYQPVTSPCGAPGETSLVEVAQPALTTDAIDQATLGQPISDTATLTGGVPTPPASGPTGTITFTLFGPNDPTCAGAAVFTSMVPVNGNGTYQSGPFTPTATGTYNWVAVYSGDANNGVATSPCGAPDESSTITVVPTIDITKTPNPASRPEPGGDFTYTLVVTNTSNENLTITSLTDDVYGDVTTRPNSTCTTAIGTVLTPGGSYTCQFTAPFTGNSGASLRNVATVVAVNPGGVNVTDNDDAVVNLTGTPPTIQVDKTANPTSRPEPGGDFTYTVVVTNTSAFESVTITSLNDSVYGDLAARPGSTCGTLIGTTLAPGASSAPCTFTAPFTGNAGASLTDVVTAMAVDDDGETATDTDDATVTLTDVLPVISVVKTADPLTRPEPGGDFTFTVVVTNNSIEPVTITSLTDNIYGNLNGRGTCATGAVLQPGQSYTCSFTGPFTGNAGASQTDVVTAIAVDDDGDTATDDDDATVTILNVVPAITVEKDASPASRPEPGGEFTFNVRVTNTGNEAVTITSLTDNIYGNLNGRGTCATGAVLQPGQSYTCSFTGPFTGNAGASQTDVVTAIAVDDDGTTVTDNDDATVTLTGQPPVIDVTKTANPLSRPEPGGDFTYTVVVRNTSPNETVTITSLNDSVYGNLTTRPNSTCTNAIGTVLPPGQSYTCQFTAPFTGDGGRSLTDVVTATAVDDDGQTATDNDDATVTITDVLPTIRVDKTASPLSRPEPGGSFTFSVVVTNTSNEPVRITSLTDDVYGNLNGRGTCATGATLQPGASYSCSFTGNFTGDAGATQTDTVTAVAVDNENNQAVATDIATVTITDVLPTIVVDKTASPLSRPEPGGTFTFTVVVTNTSNEPVTITNLFDDVYGNLNGRGTCAIGAVLAPGSSYTCSFTGSFLGDAGQSQTDIVTATAVDNEGSRATDTDDATVTLTNVPPTISVVKTADPTSRPAPGGVFTFTVTVTNTSNEPVRITSLADDIYGNLNGQGSCVVGAVLQPNQSYTCMFPGRFEGAGGSQTDVVTAVAVDNEGSQAIAQARATVTIIPPPPPPKEPLPRTGGDVNGPARLAATLIVLGGLMVAATWRWNSSGLALAFTGEGVRGLRRFRPPAVPFWSPPPGRGGGGGGATIAPPPPTVATVLRPKPPAVSLASGMGLAADRNRSGSPQAGRTARPAARAGLNVFGVPLD